MSKKTELITVPTFTFYQEGGNPIQVRYYVNCVELEYDGHYIDIEYDQLNSLFKEIKKHLPDAQNHLNNGQ